MSNWLNPKQLFILFITFISLSIPIYARPVLQLQRVDNNVYAIIGPLGNRDPQNLGNNATFGFVITKEGVVLIDADCYQHRGTGSSLAG